MKSPIPATEIERQSCVRVLGYGQSGSGKTNFIRSWPKPILVIDFDHNLQPLAGEDGIYCLSFYDEPKEGSNGKVLWTAWQHAHVFINEIMAMWNGEWTADFPRPATIVVDSFTTISASMLDYAARLSGGTPIKTGTPAPPELQVPQMGDYGRVIKLIERVLQILNAFGTHLYVIAHEQRHLDEMKGTLVAQPLVFGKQLPGRLPIFFDTCFHFDVKTSATAEPVYIIETTPNTTCLMAKTSLRGLGSKIDWTGNKIGMCDLIEKDGKESSNGS